MKTLQPTLPADYATLLAEIKERVRSAQYAALKASCTNGSAPVGQNRDYDLNITLPS